MTGNPNNSEVYRSQIRTAIEKLRRGENVDNLDREVYEPLKKYFSAVLENSLGNNISAEKRNFVANCMREFVPLLNQKGYFDDSSALYEKKLMADCLENLIEIEQFEMLPSGSTYGTYDNGEMKLDFSLNGDFLKHIIFHEMAHCITPFIGWPENEHSPMTPVTYIRECIAESIACNLSGYKGNHNVRE